MGYSTTLYAIDLDELRAAVGSNDATLVELAQAVVCGSEAADPTQGPRIKVTRGSQIILNGQPVTLDELRAAVRDPRWAGTYVYWYHERGRKEGVWSEPGSFMGALQAALAEAALAGTRIAGVMCCDTEEELLTGWDDEDELPEEQAVADLVAGTFTRPDCSYDYGLERLCEVLGTRLGVIEGKGHLKALKLDTPLGESRPPVRLPGVDAFPYVSHLTAEEVRREVERLEGTDLAYPRSALIEQDRWELLQHLRAAARQGRAVVAFYS